MSIIYDVRVNHGINKEGKYEFEKMDELQLKTKSSFKPPKIVQKKDGDYSVEYYPFPRQNMMHTSTCTQILYGGAAGGGKSIAIRWECYIYCLRNAGLQAFLFRRFRTELERNHIQFIREEVPTSLATYNKQKNILEFVNGSRLHFCYCDREDDVSLYQGAEIHLLVVDEATHLSSYQLNYLRTRVRLGSYVGDPRLLDKHIFPRTIFATNPHGGPGHFFLKNNFVDAAPEETVFPDKTTEREEEKDALGNIIKPYYAGIPSIYIPAKMSDNFALDENYDVQFTGLPPEKIKALKDGDWSSLVGAALPGLSERRHKIPDILTLYKQGKFNFLKYWNIFASVDWGTAAPFSIGYYCVPDQWLELTETKTGRIIDIPTDSVIRFAEIYGCLPKQENKGLGLPADAVCRKMLAFEKENDLKPDYYVADYQMWAKSNGPSPESHFRKHGVMLRQAKKDRAINYAEILSRIHGNPAFKKEGEGDHPMIFFTENCHAFWRTVPPLLLDDLDPNKGPANKQEDHVYDDLSYACRSRPFTLSLANREEQALERWRDQFRDAKEEAGIGCIDPYATY